VGRLGVEAGRLRLQGPLSIWPPLSLYAYLVLNTEASYIAGFNPPSLVYRNEANCCSRLAAAIY
jgi:hypothetical protein